MKLVYIETIIMANRLSLWINYHAGTFIIINRWQKSVENHRRTYQMKNKDYEVLLFDLDGTVTDSGPGIMKGFEYAINKIKGEDFEKGNLRRFVGPPLESSFSDILGFDEDETKRAVENYREYYFDKGIYENEVYEGIEKVLGELKDRGKKLSIATSKNTNATEIVLKYFDLNKYFDFVATSNFADRKTKSDVIRYALDHFSGTDKSKILMIGDRLHDVNAANEIGLDSVGVLWGYGDREELEKAGATYIIEKPEELTDIY